MNRTIRKLSIGILATCAAVLSGCASGGEKGVATLASHPVGAAYGDWLSSKGREFSIEKQGDGFVAHRKGGGELHRGRFIRIGEATFVESKLPESIAGDDLPVFQYGKLSVDSDTTSYWPIRGEWMREQLVKVPGSRITPIPENPAAVGAYLPDAETMERVLRSAAADESAFGPAETATRIKAAR